jgi:DNA-binding PadR family transcriptional regulator
MPVRLARDGKVVVGEPEAGAGPDRKRYVITEQGARREEDLRTRDQAAGERDRRFSSPSRPSRSTRLAG